MSNPAPNPPAIAYWLFWGIIIVVLLVAFIHLINRL